MMNKRSNQLELMDLGPAHYTAKEYADCLHKLGIIGTVLGGDRATLKAFAALPSPPGSILDVGCGGGSFTYKLAQRYPQATVVGIEIDAAALGSAHRYQRPNLTFQLRQQPELAEPDKSFDVVTATLVCHHLTDEQLINFFRSAGRIARKAIIINDLHRHPLAYAAFACIAPLFNNRLIRYDGLISIQRSFTRKELVRILLAADFSLQRFRITWHWAFRWIIVVDCEDVRDIGPIAPMPFDSPELAQGERRISRSSRACRGKGVSLSHLGEGSNGGGWTAHE